MVRCLLIVEPSTIPMSVCASWHWQLHKAFFCPGLCKQNLLSSRVMEKHRAGQAFNLVRDQITLPDVTISLHERKWQVHSDLLTTESGFFRAALRDGFKVSGSSGQARGESDQARKPRPSR